MRHELCRLLIRKRKKFKAVVISAAITQYGPHVPRLSLQRKGKRHDFTQVKFGSNQNPDSGNRQVPAMPVEAPGFFIRQKSQRHRKF